MVVGGCVMGVRRRCVWEMVVRGMGIGEGGMHSNTLSHTTTHSSSFHTILHTAKQSIPVAL